MLRQTFAHIRDISFNLADPPKGSRVMHSFLCSNLKLTRKVLTKNLLRKMMNMNVGTNEVERYVLRTSSQSVRNERNVRLIRNMMRSKVEDAEYDERCTRRQFVKNRKDYRRMVRLGSFVDLEFNMMMRYEVEFVWNNGKMKNAEKIDTLVRRYVPQMSSKEINMFTI